MAATVQPNSDGVLTDKRLPVRRDLFIDGRFVAAVGGRRRTFNPATQDDLGPVAWANTEDVDAAVRAAHAAFTDWRARKPAERGAMLHHLAAAIREIAPEIGWLDALNTGNPISAMAGDAGNAAAQVAYFAGLVHEVKGETLPMGAGVLNYSVREPLGVVARIVAYNHPFMFLASKLAPAVAAGNTVVLKAPDQAPLSAYRLAELVADIFPPGVVNILTGGRECGEALVSHPLVRKATLIGSTATGRAMLRAAAEKIMPVSLELGGKNPLILCADADLDIAIDGAIAGMNFTWAGQSCGSTSRCFVHQSIYEEVLAELASRIPARHRCGVPTDPETTMGALINEAQFDKVMGFIAETKAAGARLVCGGGPPS